MNRDPCDRATACCLSIVSRYRAVEGSSRGRAQMAAEVEVVLAYLVEVGLAPGEAEARVLAAAEGPLLACFGGAVGGRLHAELGAAFAAAARNPLARAEPPRPDRPDAAGRPLALGGGRERSA